MHLTQKFRAIFATLDKRLMQENKSRKKSGAILIGPVKIKILGQTALLLADLPFPIAGTMDLDAQMDGDYQARKILSEILLPEGLYLESDDHLIWMPEETKYHKWYEGNCVTVFMAEAEAVIASKTKYKRQKDKELIRTYLQHFPRAKQRLKDWGISPEWAL